MKKSKEDIIEELTCLSEQDDDWEKIKSAFNLGLDIAAENIKINTYTKGQYKKAKWRLVKNKKFEFDPSNKDLKWKVDKLSILKNKL